MKNYLKDHKISILGQYPIRSKDCKKQKLFFVAVPKTWIPGSLTYVKQNSNLADFSQASEDEESDENLESEFEEIDAGDSEDEVKQKRNKRKASDRIPSKPKKKRC